MRFEGRRRVEIVAVPLLGVLTEAREGGREVVASVVGCVLPLISQCRTLWVRGA